MLNLEKRELDLSCSDQIMATIYNYFLVPDYYPLAFVDQWGFKYDIDENGFVGKNVSQYSHNDNLMEKLLGVKLTHHVIDETQNFYDHIKSELDLNRPVIAHVDSYYSPWDAFYHKTHGEHSIILTGVNLEKNEIYCSDRYYSNKIETLPYTQSPDIFKDYATIEFTNRVNEWKESDCNKLILDHLNKILNDDIFSRINSFANFIESDFNMHEIYEDIDKKYALYDIKLCKSLNQIGYSRRVFVKSLEYLKIKYRKYDLDYFIDNILMLSMKWVNSCNLILKSAINKREINMSKIAILIREIGEKENYICKELVQYFEGSYEVKVTEEENSLEDDLSPQNFISIDISKYMNNKAFASNGVNIEKANLSYTGQFYSLNNKINGIVSHKSLDFPVKIDDNECTYDNMICDEQIISFEPDYYTHILFIMCAQFGNQECDVTINFEDSSQNLTIKVSDWRSNNAYNDIIILKNQAWETVNELKNQYLGNAHLFLQCIRLPSDKIITGIGFPYRPNINLFSVGLLKKS